MKIVGFDEIYSFVIAIFEVVYVPARYEMSCNSELI